MLYGNSFCRLVWSFGGHSERIAPCGYLVILRSLFPNQCRRSAALHLHGCLLSSAVPARRIGGLATDFARSLAKSEPIPGNQALFQAFVKLLNVPPHGAHGQLTAYNERRIASWPKIRAVYTSSASQHSAVHPRFTSVAQDQPNSKDFHQHHLASWLALLDMSIRMSSSRHSRITQCTRLQVGTGTMLCHTPHHTPVDTPRTQSSPNSGYLTMGHRQMLFTNCSKTNWIWMGGQT
jgi:hypothetical protein